MLRLLAGNGNAPGRAISHEDVMEVACVKKDSKLLHFLLECGVDLLETEKHAKSRYGRTPGTAASLDSTT